MKRKTKKYRIRKNSMTEDVYLNRQGQWTIWDKAAKFSSIAALERFAAANGIDIYGIF